MNKKMLPSPSFCTATEFLDSLKNANPISMEGKKFANESISRLEGDTPYTYRTYNTLVNIASNHVDESVREWGLSHKENIKNNSNLFNLYFVMESVSKQDNSVATKMIEEHSNLLSKSDEFVTESIIGGSLDQYSALSDINMLVKRIKRSEHIKKTIVENKPELRNPLAILGKDMICVFNKCFSTVNGQMSMIPFPNPQLQYMTKAVDTISDYYDASIKSFVFKLFMGTLVVNGADGLMMLDGIVVDKDDLQIRFKHSKDVANGNIDTFGKTDRDGLLIGAIISALEYWDNMVILDNAYITEYNTARKQLIFVHGGVDKQSFSVLTCFNDIGMGGNKSHTIENTTDVKVAIKQTPLKVRGVLTDMFLKQIALDTLRNDSNTSNRNKFVESLAELEGTILRVDESIQKMVDEGLEDSEQHTNLTNSLKTLNEHKLVLESNIDKLG